MIDFIKGVNGINNTNKHSCYKFYSIWQCHFILQQSKTTENFNKKCSLYDHIFRNDMLNFIFNSQNA